MTGSFQYLRCTLQSNLKLLLTLHQDCTPYKQGFRKHLCDCFVNKHHRLVRSPEPVFCIAAFLRLSHSWAWLLGLFLSCWNAPLEAMLRLPQVYEVTEASPLGFHVNHAHGWECCYRAKFRQLPSNSKTVIYSIIGLCFLHANF